MLERAKTFATLIDKFEFAKAGRMLAETCIYHLTGTEIKGRDAVINSYSSHFQSGRKKLDETKFTSTVEASEDGKYKLKFLDRLRKGDQWHEYRCEQILTFTGNFISEILHVELPGQAEGLQAFYERMGLSQITTPVEDRSEKLIE